MKATDTFYATLGLLLCSLGLRFLNKAGSKPTYPRADDFSRGLNKQPLPKEFN